MIAWKNNNIKLINFKSESLKLVGQKKCHRSWSNPCLFSFLVFFAFVLLSGFAFSLCIRQCCFYCCCCCLFQKNHWNLDFSDWKRKIDVYVNNKINKTFLVSFLILFIIYLAFVCFAYASFLTTTIFDVSIIKNRQLFSIFVTFLVFSMVAKLQYITYTGTGVRNSILHIVGDLHTLVVVLVYKWYFYCCFLAVHFLPPFFYTNLPINFLKILVDLRKK